MTPMREFDLLDHVFSHNAALPDHVTIPPGDDMGAVRIGDQTVLVTVDQVADGVHVDVANTPLALVGRKAITRNLSDVAAMAARPVGAVVAAALPRDFGEARAHALFDAMRATGVAYNCPLVGGDISMWDQPLLLSVTIFAEPDGIEPVTRRGARVGDAVFVTGALGGSLRGHHLDFEPRIAMARELAAHRDMRPHCMIDLSDGLGRDLGHLCHGVAAVIDADALPISDAVDTPDRWRQALGDGEDYELCFTIDPQRASRLPSRLHDAAITRVGSIVAARPDGPRVVVRLPDGREVDVADIGWEHRGP
jgi:thiamine-monophosphate kinase